MEFINICVLTFVFINLSSVGHAAIDLKESYIGCYRNISSTKTVASVGSVDRCSVECNLEINNMIALKNGKECNCIGRLDSAVASSQCDVPCDNKDACGGSASYSVYKSKPRVMHDAYASMDNRQTKSIEMTLPADYTLETCAHFCLETNHTFFQTIRDKLCSCFQEHKVGNIYKQKQICTKCKHNPYEVCECYHETHQAKTTIFATRFQYDFQRGVSSYSHCRKSRSIEIKATCPSGCDPGWRGDSCRERDCEKNSGDCPVGMKCIESIVNSIRYVECVCSPAKVRNKWFKCEVFRRNIALQKPPYYIDSSHHRKIKDGHFAYNKFYLTDGIYDGFFISHIDGPMTAWMAVDLLNLYCVGFIKAYNRMSIRINSVHRMNWFVVRLNETLNTTSKDDISNQTNLCGYGPEIALQSGNPIVVFCENFTIFSQFVIIQQSDEKLHENFAALAELEVFEAGCDLSNGGCGNEMCTEYKQNTTVICCGDDCLLMTTTTAAIKSTTTATESDAIKNSYMKSDVYIDNSTYLTYITLGVVVPLWLLVLLIITSLFKEKRRCGEKRRSQFEDTPAEQPDECFLVEKSSRQIIVLANSFGTITSLKVKTSFNRRHVFSQTIVELV
ncbi:hypothetical protein HELRODRAFT_161814 [Helobdella robusta]|uniref:WSC domain-containing protein n=1 Tax=Helobdella robusta TaxID=6412 RepID=T1ERY0_HELRO|nr:hypothetical protein HELRODRAFT_161814 [Helobdella robusta]ESO02533.1 hypothetical protein HELRODRAFT_161814 [Helobdella robusta]